MTCRSSFVYSDKLLDYHFHLDHPFNQIRVKLTKDLLQAAHSLDPSDIVEPRSATDEELMLFHDAEYIQAV